MRASDIPSGGGYRKLFRLSDILDRARSHGMANWSDFPCEAGIYAVCWLLSQDLVFLSVTGGPPSARSINPDWLRQKSERILRRGQTDIIYIGATNCLRRRLRYLARFGVGKSSPHEGGEWMWQIANIESAHVMVQACPSGREVAFENSLLEMFQRIHGEYPLANRKGPQGQQRWLPHD